MMDKLKYLLSHCKCGIFITVNEHRDIYQSVQDALEEIDARDPEISDDVRKKMIETDTIINIHFYPLTPIGFYDIYHYDLEMALDDALSCFKE
jgi:hypothetical protein